MTERIQNNINASIGQAKQTVGETLGMPNLAAQGATQKTDAQNAQKLADAKTNLEGAGHTLQGQLEQKAGNALHDPALVARGKANENLGNVQQQV